VLEPGVDVLLPLVLVLPLPRRRAIASSDSRRDLFTLASVSALALASASARAFAASDEDPVIPVVVSTFVCAIAGAASAVPRTAAKIKPVDLYFMDVSWKKRPESPVCNCVTPSCYESTTLMASIYAMVQGSKNKIFTGKTKMKYSPQLLAVLLACATFQAAAATPITDEIRGELAPQGTLRVAIAVGTAPTAFRAIRDRTTGEPRGVTVELANTLAQRLGSGWNWSPSIARRRSPMQLLPARGTSHSSRPT